MPNHKIIIANWKMHKTPEEATKFIDNLEIQNNIDLIIAPHHLLLGYLSQANLGLTLSSQNISISLQDEGSVTGGISPYLLKSFGVKYCILGHKEVGDDIGVVREKAKALAKHGIMPIICVGENDKHKAKAQVIEQLKSLLAIDDACDFARSGLIIAYEPNWAVNNHEASLDFDLIYSIIYEIESFARSINIENNLKIVYGGSVDEASLPNLLKIKALSGFLVGRASLEVSKLNNLMKSCLTYS